MIMIVDYGMGNLGSVFNMFKRIGAESAIVNDPAVLEQADKILLPGVGAFDAAMDRINDSGFREVLDRQVLQHKTPVLGICLGMQLLSDGSEEGNTKGLGWIPADTLKFSFADTPSLKIPHIGWNEVEEKNASPITCNLPADPRFYFVHSYHVKCRDDENVVSTSEYGISFHSIIQKDNIYGAQFHPEKSHKYGMKFLENFASL